MKICENPWILRVGSTDLVAATCRVQKCEGDPFPNSQFEVTPESPPLVEFRQPRRIVRFFYHGQNERFLKCQFVPTSGNRICQIRRLS